jgi:hypothetical protein
MPVNSGSRTDELFIFDNTDRDRQNCTKIYYYWNNLAAVRRGWRVGVTVFSQCRRDHQEE